MYFSEQERNALTAIMVQHGVDPAAVLFVKKRGRLFVQVQGRKDEFAFLSKKAVSLDPGGQWVNRVDYFVGASKTDKQVTWEDLIIAFTAWLKGQ